MNYLMHLCLTLLITLTALSTNPAHCAIYREYLKETRDDTIGMRVDRAIERARKFVDRLVTGPTELDRRNEFALQLFDKREVTDLRFSEILAANQIKEDPEFERIYGNRSVEEQQAFARYLSLVYENVPRGTKLNIPLVAAYMFNHSALAAAIAIQYGANGYSQ